MTERTANIALSDYNATLYNEKQEWTKKLQKPTTVRKAPEKNKSFWQRILGL